MFVFDEMDISAQLMVNGVNIGASQATGLISEINTDVTNGCLNGLYSSYVVDPSPGEVGFIMPDQPNLQYSLPVNGQPLYLFTIVVDAYPGETIDLAVSGNYSSGPVFNEMFISACSSNPLQVTFPEPAACSNNAIVFGQSTGGGNTQAMIPVSITNVGTSIEEIDVNIEVTFDNIMMMPQVIGQDIPTSDISVFLNPAGNYTIYAHTRDIFSATGNLFRILIDGPVFISSGGSATLTFQNGRYEPGNDNCCKPSLGQPSAVTFDGFPDCGGDLKIRASAEASATGNCDDLEVTFTADYSGPDLTFYKFYVVADLDMGSNMSIVGELPYTNSIPCPGNGGCNPNSNGDCFEIVDNNTIRYCFFSITGAVIKSGEGFKVLLNAPDGCLEGITFREAYVDLTGGGTNVACVPLREINTTFPVCTPLLSGTVLKEDGNKVRDNYTITVTNTDSPGLCDYTLNPGCSETYSLCVCNRTDSYTVTPSKNDGVRCGVTTFDLVTITKHILGVQPLGSPYKIIAADANNSGGVSTFDLVELRKLILHIYETLPNNTSWRFVDKSYVFPNLTNPFLPTFPESVHVNSGAFPADASFVAIKVGDVNGSCGTGSCFAGEEVADRGLGDLAVEAGYNKARAGGTVSMPIALGEQAGLAAFQAGFGFDTGALEFTGFETGFLQDVSEQNFGFTELEKGRVRMLWQTPFGQDKVLPPHAPLFYLNFRAKRAVNDLSGLVWLDSGILASEGYTTDGKEYRLTLKTLPATDRTKSRDGFSARCLTNPISGQVTLEVQVPKACMAGVMLYGRDGQRLAYQSSRMEPGANTVSVDNLEGMPSGLLFWKVRTPFGSTSGSIVKN